MTSKATGRNGPILALPLANVDLQNVSSKPNGPGSARKSLSVNTTPDSSKPTQPIDIRASTAGKRAMNSHEAASSRSAAPHRRTRAVFASMEAEELASPKKGSPNQTNYRGTSPMRGTSPARPGFGPVSSSKPSKDVTEIIDLEVEEDKFSPSELIDLRKLMLNKSTSSRSEPHSPFVGLFESRMTARTSEHSEDDQEGSRSSSRNPTPSRSRDASPAPSPKAKENDGPVQTSYLDVIAKKMAQKNAQKSNAPAQKSSAAKEDSTSDSDSIAEEPKKAAPKKAIPKPLSLKAPAVPDDEEEESTSESDSIAEEPKKAASKKPVEKPSNSLFRSNDSESEEESDSGSTNGAASEPEDFSAPGMNVFKKSTVQKKGNRGAGDKYETDSNASSHASSKASTITAASNLLTEKIQDSNGKPADLSDFMKSEVTAMERAMDKLAGLPAAEQGKRAKELRDSLEQQAGGNDNLIKYMKASSPIRKVVGKLDALIDGGKVQTYIPTGHALNHEKSITGNNTGFHILGSHPDADEIRKIAFMNRASGVCSAKWKGKFSTFFPDAFFPHGFTHAAVSKVLGSKAIVGISRSGNRELCSVAGQKFHVMRFINEKEGNVIYDSTFPVFLFAPYNKVRIIPFGPTGNPSKKTVSPKLILDAAVESIKKYGANNSFRLKNNDIVIDVAPYLNLGEHLEQGVLIAFPFADLKERLEAAAKVAYEEIPAGGKRSDYPTYDLLMAALDSLKSSDDKGDSKKN